MSQNDLKRAFVKKAFPDLEEEVLTHLVEVARMVDYPVGKTLCVEDAHEDTFYLLVSGEVEFSKIMGEVDKVLRKGIAGDYFGEMALLDDKIGRSATVRTSEPTTVIEIDRDDFREMVMKQPTVVLAMSKILIYRMRENDRAALSEMQSQKDEIERAYADLQRLNHQRQLFLTTLAHEIRTPLTSVMGYMGLIRGGHLQGEALSDSLGQMGKNMDRMVSLINDLLFLQETEAVDPHFKAVDLQNILQAVIDKNGDYATKQGVTLALEIDGDLPEMVAEEDGLARAFDHLVNNGIKFSPEGGDVMVSAKRLGDHVMLKFSDNGVGISPEFMPRLFMRFERDETYGKHLFDGTGLGMPIVKQIVDMHAGQIDVDSVRGEGTTFTVRLPVNALRATQEISIDDAWVDVPD